MQTNWPKPTSAIVGRSVLVGDVEVGTVASLLASRGLAYVFGLQVRGRDGHDHFVPWVAGDLDGGGVRLRSVFSLLSSSELALYVDNGVRLDGDRGPVLVRRDGRIVEGSAASTAPDGSATRRSTSAVQASAKRSMP
jgi:hypothetical protein